MRVLMLSHTYLPAHYRGKLRRLAEAGVELTLVALPALRLPTGSVLRFEATPEPFRVRLARPLAFAGHHALRLYAPPQAAGWLRAARPQLVHVEAEPHSLALGLMALLKRRFGYRMVAFSWENLRRRGRWPLSWLERWSLRQVDWMIAGSAEAGAVLRWRGYGGPLTVLPQVGIDAAHFAPGPPREPGPGDAGRFRIGFAGRLVAQKGVLDLLEAFIPLAGQAGLVFVGEGPLADAIRRRAAEAGCGERVSLEGYVPYRDMPARLARLDVLVLPSRTTACWKEQFGHVLAEAMLAGVPVIGSDSGAIPEVIGSAGLVFPEGDVAALRERLVWLLEHPHERQRLARLGRERALAHYGDQAIARHTLQVYRQVLEGA